MILAKKKSVLVLILVLSILSCQYKQEEENENRGHKSSRISNLSKTVPIPLDSSLEYYYQLKEEIISNFNTADSLGWSKKGQIIDSIFVGEGSGWQYWKKDSLSKYLYGKYGCGGRTESIFLCKYEQLLLRISKEIGYGVPLGYDREVALSEEDSIEYEEDYIVEEFSFFENDNIVKQISADCGAPNSVDYVKRCEQEITTKLNEIQKLTVN